MTTDLATQRDAVTFWIAYLERDATTATTTLAPYHGDPVALVELLFATAEMFTEFAAITLNTTDRAAPAAILRDQLQRAPHTTPGDTP